MKFREFLQDVQEKYIDNTRARKEWELMAEGYMPLQPALFQPFEKSVVAYHVTSIKAAKTVIKLQNRRKTISAFTKGSTGIASGAFENSEILFTLKGKTSFTSSKDIGSVLDRNGIKWIKGMNTLTVNNDFTVPMQKAIVKEFKLRDRYSIKQFVELLPGKMKSKFINFFYSTAKKLITKTFVQKLTKEINDSYEGSSYKNNELFFHSFEIIKTQLISDESSRKFDIKNVPNVERRIGIKIDSVISRNDVSILEIK